MESALNDWLERVEEQVNNFETEKASAFDLQQLEMKLQTEVRDRQNSTDQILQIAQNAEKICNRLTDDALAAVEEVRHRQSDGDERTAQMVRYLEDKIRILERGGNFGEASPDTFKLTSGDTFRTQGPQQNDMVQLETKISKRMSESIESLADIIKDYARKYRRLTERVGDVEVKLFGAAREDKPRKTKKMNSSIAGKENTSMNRGSIVQQRKSPNTSMNRGGQTPPVKEEKKKKKKDVHRSKSK